MEEVSLKIDLNDEAARKRLAELNAEFARPRKIPVDAAVTTSAGGGGVGGGLADVAGGLGSTVAQARGLIGGLGGVIGDLGRVSSGSADAVGSLVSRLPSMVRHFTQLAKSLSDTGKDQPAWLQVGAGVASMFGPIGAAVAGIATTAYALFSETDRAAEEAAAAERERQAELNRLRNENFKQQWSQYQQLSSQIASLQLGGVLEKFNAIASSSNENVDSWEKRQTRRLSPELSSEEKAVEQQRISLTANARRLEELSKKITETQSSPLAALNKRELPGTEEVLRLEAEYKRLSALASRGTISAEDNATRGAIGDQLRVWESPVRDALESIGIGEFTDLATGVKQLEQIQKAYNKQLKDLVTAYDKAVDAVRDGRETLLDAELQEEAVNQKRLNELLKESRPDTPETRAADIQAKAVERYNSLMKLGLGTDEASEATVGWLRNQNTKNKTVNTYSGVVASDLMQVGGGGRYSAAEIQTVTQSDSDRLLTRILSVLTASKDLQAKFLEQDFDAGAILY